MRDKIESFGTKNRESRKTIQSEIINTNGNMVRIEKTAENVSVVLSNFEKETVGKLEVTSGKVSAEVSRAQKEENRLSGLISQNESSILLKVSKGDISAEISQESEDIYFRGNRFEWESENSSMTPDGTIECNGIKANNGNFSGNVKGTNISGGEIRASKINGNTINAKSLEAIDISSAKVKVDLLTAVQLNTKTKFYSQKDTVVNIPNELRTRQISATSQEPSDINFVTTKEYVGPLPEQSSDFRLKNEIIQIETSDSRNVLRQLKPVMFLYRKYQKNGIGFIAQEVESLLDNIPFKNAMYSVGVDGIYTIPYDNYIGIIANNIIDLKKRIDVIKNKRGEK